MPATQRISRGAPPRSCLECRRRKVKCDRQQPCDYCTKIGLQCIYPQPKSTQSVLSDPTFDMLSKIRRMEIYIQRLEDRVQRLEAGEPHFSKESTDAHAKEVPVRTESEVQGHGTVAYDTHSAGNSPAKAGPQSSHIFLPRLSLVDNIAAESISANLPSPNHRFILWQVYVENVDPLLKLIDRPSIRTYITSTNEEISALSPDIVCLLYAVYFSAVASIMCPSWTREFLHEEQSKLLSQYSRGLEFTLSQSGFASAPNITTLQALVLYLTCGRRQLDEGLVWTLLGVVLRLAYKLQLHKDPAYQSYSPFQCEIRRRLLWTIVALETRSAEDNGCDSLIHQGDFDTRLPANINDIDMYPDMEAVPQSILGPSDMMYALVRMEVTLALRPVLFSSQFARRNGSDALSAVGKSNVLDRVWADLESRYFNHCDVYFGRSDIKSPISFISFASSRLVFARLKLMLYHPQQQDHVEASGEALMTLLRTSAEIIEHSEGLRNNPVYRKWVWLFQRYVEWDAAAFILLHLNLRLSQTRVCRDTEARSRAALQTFFKAWEAHVDKDREHKWKRLVKLMERVEYRAVSTELTVMKDPLGGDPTGEAQRQLPAAQPGVQAALRADTPNATAATGSESVNSLAQKTSKAPLQSPMADHSATSGLFHDAPSNLNWLEIIEGPWENLERTFENGQFDNFMHMESNGATAWN